MAGGRGRRRVEDPLEPGGARHRLVVGVDVRLTGDLDGVGGLTRDLAGVHGQPEAVGVVSTDQDLAS